MSNPTPPPHNSPNAQAQQTQPTVPLPQGGAPYHPHYAPGPQPYSASAPQNTSYAAEPPAPIPAPAPSTLAHTNTYALVSILLVFIMPLAGIIFGHLALGQIKRSGDTGRGMALTATILGYTFFAFVILYVIWIFVMFAALFAGIAELSQLGSEFGTDPYMSDEFDF